ncbi:ABC transporter ATP-binding protein/permease [Ensifer sp.]|uniref:ABC transporter ATP-binding protein/permease n=1 Tax=Ensifer sp. TaxID=1872086 RepID=UPI002E128E71|nr:ABC transporter ATP-binding protein/permease [Ensifer sp.]
MLKLAGQFLRLIAICVRHPGGKADLALLGIVVALTLGSVYASVRLIEWTGAFYSAIEKIDGPAILTQIGVFAVIVGLNSARHLLAEYLRKILEIRWRQALTEKAITLWTKDKAYWHMANAVGDRIDNPDQRIAEDCRLFVRGMLSEALDLISRVVGLFSFVAVLWALASFPLSLSPIGIDIEIPHYMVWAAFLYVAVSSVVTHLLGKPLKPLFAQQQHREADFRYAMARWRSNFDEVALAGGEAAEVRLFRQRFGDLAQNWRRLIRRELVLGSFTYPFNHSVLRIPLFVALPGYIAGHVAFGGLMQLSNAFSQVVTTLSWFIFSYRDLADLVATAARLDDFMENARARLQTPSAIVRSDRAKALQLTGLNLRTPDRRHLLDIPELHVRPGECVWLKGASGIGKSTLMKAVAGYWPHGEGEVDRAREGWMFMPQTSYLPLGSLAEAVAYPAPADDIGSASIKAFLTEVGLAHRLDDSDNPVVEAGLSGGERQRLAFARLLAHAPRWVMLDEATSALDASAETQLLQRVRERLPETAFIVIAHRPPQALGDFRTIDLDLARHDAAAA